MYENNSLIRSFEKKKKKIPIQESECYKVTEDFKYIHKKGKLKFIRMRCHSYKHE